MSFPSSPTVGQVFVTPGGKTFVWSVSDGWCEQTDNGANIISGPNFPANTIGNNGDYYLGTNPSAIYGPKAAGVWPLPGTLLTPATDPAMIFPTSPVSTLYIGFSILTSVAVSGGTAPYSYAITAGALPAGLNFTSSTGAISGTPTGPAGSYTFTITATDGVGNTVSHTYSGTVNVITALVFPTTLPTLTQATAYNAPVTASGGVPPYSYSVVSGVLPPGLALGVATGIISGQTPNAVAYSFTVQVVDARGVSTTNAYSGTIQPLNNLVITPAYLNIQQSLAISTTLVSTGVSPFSWTISSGALPSGVSLNATTGLVSGTPTGSGAYNFTVKVTDSTSNTTSLKYTGAANATATLTIYPPSMTVSSGAVISQTFTANGGTSPYTWSIASGSLPNGLSLNTTTGVISGTDNPSGAWAFTLRVVDHVGYSTFQAYSGNDAVVPGSQTWVGSNGFTGPGYPVDTNSAFTIPPYNWLVIEVWGPGGGGGSAGWQDGINGSTSTCNGVTAVGGGGGIGQQLGGAEGFAGWATGGNAANIAGNPGQGWAYGLPIGGGAGANGGSGGAGGRWGGSAGNFPGGGGGGGAAGDGGGGGYAKSTYVPGALAVGQSIALTAGGGGNGGYAGSTWANGGPGAAGKVTITWG